MANLKQLNDNKTYFLNDLDEEFDNGSFNFTLFHINIVSLNKNADKLKTFLSSCNLKVYIILLYEIRNINLTMFESLFHDF